MIQSLRPRRKLLHPFMACLQLRPPCYQILALRYEGLAMVSGVLKQSHRYNWNGPKKSYIPASILDLSRGDFPPLVRRRSNRRG